MVNLESWRYAVILTAPFVARQHRAGEVRIRSKLKSPLSRASLGTAYPCLRRPGLLPPTRYGAIDRGICHEQLYLSLNSSEPTSEIVADDEHQFD